MMLLRVAWRNIVRGWRRSAIIISAMGFGLGASLLLMGLSKGMVKQMTDTAVQTQLGHIAVHARGYFDNPDIERNLPEGGRAVLARLGERPEVAASARLRGDGLVQSARHSARAVFVGVDPEAEGRVSSVPGSIVEGSFLRDTPPAVRRTRRLPPVVIGEKMAERLRVGLGDKVVLHAPGESGLGAFRVRGIYRTDSSDFDGAHAFLRLQEAQRLFGIGDRVTEVTLLLSRPRRARALQAWLEQYLPGVEFEVLRWQERAPRLAAMLELMTRISWILYAGIFIAMAFGIANVLFMAVFERIREFGVLRAMGLQPRRLVAMVLLESLLLTMAGTAAGLALGWQLVGWFKERGLDLAWFAEGLRAYGIGTAIRTTLDVSDLMWPVVIAAITAFVAGLAPALRAVRLRPAEALRHT
jgi:ABC-type lipoprotein release transport system permease subunit